jgi:hypothetical protein
MVRPILRSGGSKLGAIIAILIIFFLIALKMTERRNGMNMTRNRQLFAQ